MILQANKTTTGSSAPVENVERNEVPSIPTWNENSVSLVLSWVLWDSPVAWMPGGPRKFLPEKRGAQYGCLGGGFKYFLFSSLFEEMIQFD